FRIGRGSVVREAVPCREGQEIELGAEEGDGRGKPRHATVIAADMQQLPRIAGCQAAEDEGVVPLGRAVDHDAAMRPKLRQSRGQAGRARYLNARSRRMMSPSHSAGSA